RSGPAWRGGRFRRGLPARRDRPGTDRGGPCGGDDGSDAMTVTPQLSEEVEAALRHGRPVVALETTLVSHGFPGVQGLQAALAAEARARRPAAARPRIGTWAGRGGAGPPRQGRGDLASPGRRAGRPGRGDL